MSKQTTTDFREKLEKIFEKNTIALTRRKYITSFDEVVFNAYQAKQQILATVSELVEESLERILKDGHGGGNWRRLIELERERCKEALK